jgi:hypothetical protein
LVRVYCLPPLTQRFRNAAALQHAQDEERAPAGPNPTIQQRSSLPSLSQRIEQSGLRQLSVIAVAYQAQGVRDGLKETQSLG